MKGEKRAESRTYFANVFLLTRNRWQGRLKEEEEREVRR